MAQRRVVEIAEDYIEAAAEFLVGTDGRLNLEGAQAICDLITDFEISAKLDDTPEKFVALLARVSYTGIRIGFGFGEICAALAHIFEQAKNNPGTPVEFGRSS